MKASRRLADNVATLLMARRHKQTDLAQWCRRSDVWVSQFLRGERNWQLDDLDRVADFFGLATYQLFQPGIATSTERRMSPDRRVTRERRIGHSQRLVAALGASLDTARPVGLHEAPHADPATAKLRALVRQFVQQLDTHLASADAGGQAAPARKAVAGRRARGGSAGRRDAGPPETSEK